MIYIEKYEAKDNLRLAVNENEIWRYAGYRGGPDEEELELKKLFSDVINEVSPLLSYRVCYSREKLKWDEEMPVLPFSARSKGLAKCLKDSEEVLLFCATIGIEIDRKIARFQRNMPTKALLTQAYGAERVEALCDCFCDEIREMVNQKGLEITPRFSPGYGDLPLETQREFFQILDCNRKIGVSLNESLLMTPSKSVTAIFGLRKKKNDCGIKDTNKCASCTKLDCQYR